MRKTNNKKKFQEYDINCISDFQKYIDEYFEISLIDTHIN